MLIYIKIMSFSLISEINTMRYIYKGICVSCRLADIKYSMKCFVIHLLSKNTFIGYLKST